MGRFLRTIPFFASASGVNRAIWALGLRNPSFAIQRGTGRMFINDVGENTWERDQRRHRGIQLRLASH